MEIGGYCWSAGRGRGTSLEGQGTTNHLFDFGISTNLRRQTVG